jgi:hypothetical protein
MATTESLARILPTGEAVSQRRCHFPWLLSPTMSMIAACQRQLDKERSRWNPLSVLLQVWLTMEVSNKKRIGY